MLRVVVHLHKVVLRVHSLRLRRLLLLLGWLPAVVELLLLLVLGGLLLGLRLHVLLLLRRHHRVLLHLVSALGVLL